MNICIATGIYPPEIGGPAEYASNLKRIWNTQGHKVSVCVFSRFNRYPSGIRHFLYMLSILKPVFNADMVLVLDTMSAALPTVLVSAIFGKKIILRTGGDFLWESYTERVKDKVLLKDFYTTRIPSFSLKERITFSLIRFVLRSVDTIVWSTQWQKDIFMDPYRLQAQRHVIIENYYGERVQFKEYQKKSFVASSRSLYWKNIDMLEEVFASTDIASTGAYIDTEKVSHDQFLNKISDAYAVILISLGDISPNTILDAIRCGKPFIVTKETGIYDRIKSVALFVDPLDKDDIHEKVMWLLDDNNYKTQCEKVRQYTFTHTWEEMADEYIQVYNALI
jgi:glycosyltransferase involved in cell wall biosynthesis